MLGLVALVGLQGAVFGAGLIAWVAALAVWFGCPRDIRATAPKAKGSTARVFSPAILGLTGFFVLIALSIGASILSAIVFALIYGQVTYHWVSFDDIPFVKAITTD